jgi:hypothetical protein
MPINEGIQGFLLKLNSNSLLDLKLQMRAVLYENI